MICPYCKEYESRSVAMETNDSDSRLGHFWECAECGCRAMPGAAKVSDAEKLWNSEQAYKKMLSAKKGGGSSSKGRKKVPNKKANIYTEV